MNILAPRLEFFAIPDAVIRKSTLPHRILRTHPMREASFDKPHDALDRGTLWSQQEMNVIRHDDKSVQFVVALSAVVLQHLQKKFRIYRNLKYTAAVECRAGHKVSSRSVGTRRNSH
jgi:hypothetical protein